MHPEIPVEEITIPMFEPEEIALYDAFECDVPRRPDQAESSATISADLNPEDVTYVCLMIDPPGEAVLARRPPGDLTITSGIWVNLRPAEALELATRLRALAETAAAVLARYPDDADPNQPATAPAAP